MAAKRKPVQERVFKFAAIFFPGDSTTGIAPTSLLTGSEDERLQVGQLVKCQWESRFVDARILELGNSRYSLHEFLEDFLTGDSDGEEQAVAESEPSVKKQKKDVFPNPKARILTIVDTLPRIKMEPIDEAPSITSEHRNRTARNIQKNVLEKRKEQMDSTASVMTPKIVDSAVCIKMEPIDETPSIMSEQGEEIVGDIQENNLEKERQETDSIPSAMTIKIVDPLTRMQTKLVDKASCVVSEQGHDKNKMNLQEKEAQTSAFFTSTDMQTESQSMMEILLKKINALEEKMNNNHKEVIKAIRALKYSNESEQEIQELVPQMRLMPKKCDQSPQECQHPGFWKLYPVELLSKTAEEILEMAYEVPLDQEDKLELTECEIIEVRKTSLNQRPLFAKNLVFSFFTLKELYNRNVRGRVSFGPNKRKLNKEKMKIVETAVFDTFPVADMERAKAWSECTRAINKAILYLFSSLQKKIDFSPFDDL